MQLQQLHRTKLSQNHNYRKNTNQLFKLVQWVFRTGWFTRHHSLSTGQQPGLQMRHFERVTSRPPIFRGLGPHALRASREAKPGMRFQVLLSMHNSKLVLDDYESNGN
jgi:hypothetical protein